MTKFVTNTSDVCVCDKIHQEEKRVPPKLGFIVHVSDPLTPLLGCVVSIPTNMHALLCTVQGYTSYAGLTCALTAPADKDALMVTVLKSLGFVPFVRTNVPQAMLR